jgi:hypothetical protein
VGLVAVNATLQTTHSRSTGAAPGLWSAGLLRRARVPGRPDESAVTGVCGAVTGVFMRCVRAGLAEIQSSGGRSHIPPAGRLVTQPAVASSEEPSYDARLGRLASAIRSDLSPEPGELFVNSSILACTSRWLPTSPSSWRMALAALFAACLVAGCKATCRPGQVLRDGLCHTVPGPAVDAGAERADDGGANASRDGGSVEPRTESRRQGTTVADSGVGADESSDAAMGQRAGDIPERMNQDAGASGASTPASAAVCGNGVREGMELCDGTDCKTECVSDNACVVARIEGAAKTCDAQCTSMEITACNSSDGCCPNGCDHGTDSDCSPSCGDGVLTGTETCEPGSSTYPCATPAACDDSDPCTADTVTGNPQQCSAKCAHMPLIRAAIRCDDNDPCTDDDMVESATECAFECTHSAPRRRTGSCADSDPCTDDTPVPSTRSCSNECPHARQQRPMMSCDDSDPCTMDTPIERVDVCAYECQNAPGQRRSGPSSCNDSNPCTTDSRMDDADTCSFDCKHVPNEGSACEGPFDGMKCNAQGQCELPARGLCGNGYLDDGESCDNTSMQDCPGCDDTNPCTVDSFTGSPSQCNMVCQHMAIPGC